MIDLEVYLHGVRAGTVHTDARNSTFVYNEEYAARRDSTPVSLSMPLTALVHGPRVTNPYLAGLLPDNPDTLRRWAAEATPRADDQNPASMLRHYGADCAGAVQFRPVDSPRDLGGAATATAISVADIAKQLAAFRRDPSAWVLDDSSGRFSLGGAQAKIALAWIDKSWHQPTSSMPSTHILKPGIPEFTNNALNEHLTLRLAQACGISSANTEIRTFDGEVAIVVERYDRITAQGATRRVHQEDFCQALGVSPSQKYEDLGGPGISALVDVFRARQPRSSADRSARRILEGVFFNWLVVGPDAHAKNYSVLLEGGSVALAPLYDIASITPYPDRYNPASVKLAQSVCGKSRVADIVGSDWREQGRVGGLDGAMFLERTHEILEDATASLTEVCAEAAARAIDSEYVALYEASLLTRFEAAGRQLLD